MHTLVKCARMGSLSKVFYSLRNNIAVLVTSVIAVLLMSVDMSMIRVHLYSCTAISTRYDWREDELSVLDASAIGIGHEVKDAEEEAR